ncbi:MAG: hypothetical protein AAGE65_14685, partial [Planctomycetota bacterium]
GSFAGDPDAPPGPRVSLYWADPAAVAAVLARQPLRLVLLENGAPQPHAHVRFDRADPFRSAVRQPGLPNLSGYELQARNVTRAPGFVSIRSAVRLKPDEQLLLVLPQTLAQRLHRVVQSAMRRAGLTPQTRADVVVELLPSGRFEVKSIQARPAARRR